MLAALEQKKEGKRTLPLLSRLPKAPDERDIRKGTWGWEVSSTFTVLEWVLWGLWGVVCRGGRLGGVQLREQFFCCCGVSGGV